MFNFISNNTKKKSSCYPRSKYGKFKIKIVIRYQELDIFRGLAAIAVVLFHYTFGYDNGYNEMSDDKFYFYFGNYGVHLFFMISGFVIFMTLNRTKSSWDFIFSRFSRLYPPYWAAIILTISLTYILNAPFHKDIYNIKQVFVNFTMFQYYVGIKDVDGPYWTLAIELMFYIIMGVIFKIKKLHYIEWICCIWLFASILVVNFDFPFKKYIKVLFILEYAPLFIAGICFFLIRKDRHKIKYHIITLFALVSEMYLLHNQNAKLISYVLIISFFALFYLFIMDKLKFIINKPLLFLGSISYSLYLIHNSIGFALIYWLKKIMDAQLFYLPITIIIIIGLSSLLTFHVEKPTNYALRNWYKKTKENKTLKEVL